VTRDEAIDIVISLKRRFFNFKGCESLVIGPLDKAHRDFTVDEFMRSCDYLSDKKKELNHFIHAWRPSLGTSFDSSVMMIKEARLFGGECTTIWGTLDELLNNYTPMERKDLPETGTSSSFMQSSPGPSNPMFSAFSPIQYPSNHGPPFPWTEQHPFGSAPARFYSKTWTG
jgi:hypothetical protein